jgi:PIN domain
MIVVLDSMIWIAELGLKSSLGSVTRLYLREKNARLALPEVVRLEVERNLHNQLKEHVSEMEKKHRQLLTVFGSLNAIAMPTDSDIGARVAEVFGSLGVDVLEVPFSLPSARSSFLKTIDKSPPSDKNQQFKDGVVWADCVSLLDGDDVTLVSEDKAFYQDREYSKGLSKALAVELSIAKHQFILLPSLDYLVREFRSDVPIDEDLLTKTHLEQNRQAVERLLENNGFTLGQQLEVSKTLYATEDPSQLHVEFTLRLTAEDVSGEGRTCGILTLRGDGLYDTKLKTFANLRSCDDTLRFKDSNGVDLLASNAYAFADTVIGQRNVSHKVRHKLP